MEKKQGILVDGFLFQEKGLAEKAERELDGIKYIRNNTDMSKPQTVLQLYDKILEQELFETPVGIGYLRELQDYLYTIPSIPQKDIRPIPVESMIRKEFVSARASGAGQDGNGSQDGPGQGSGAGESGEGSGTGRPGQSGSGANAAGRGNDRNGNTGKGNGAKQGKTGMSGGMRLSLAGNVILLLAVIAMFVIATTSSHPNVLNYKEKLLDQYSSWEQNLKEREREVRMKEQELGIEP